MSSPCEVGTVPLAKTAPTLPPVSGVRRSVPEPCVAVAVGQLASGLAVALPAAVRHAALVPLCAAGNETEPAGPSTVLSWNGWLNSTVPDAKALGADAAIPTATELTNNVMAAARATVRRATTLGMASFWTAGADHEGRQDGEHDQRGPGGRSHGEAGGG